MEVCSSSFGCGERLNWMYSVLCTLRPLNRQPASSPVSIEESGENGLCACVVYAGLAPISAGLVIHISSFKALAVS